MYKKALKGISPFVYRNRNLFNYSNKFFKSSNSLQKKLSVGEAAVVLEQRISGISQVNDLKEYGSVISIGDGIARVFGL